MADRRALRAQAARVRLEVDRLLALLPPDDAEPDLPPDPAAEMVDMMRSHCRETGAVVSIDGFVDERTAAALVNRSQSTLARWRGEGKIEARRYLGRPQYSLTTLAEFAVENAMECDV